MRTYGVHGGERQLGHYFRLAAPSCEVHGFFFLYRDTLCRQHFMSIQGLELADVVPLNILPRPNLWAEFTLLLVLLPLLQLRLLWLIVAGDYRVCVVHGFQAAVAAWLPAMALRRCRFVYVHRGTKSMLGKHPIFRFLYRPFEVLSGS